MSTKKTLFAELFQKKEHAEGIDKTILHAHKKAEKILEEAVLKANNLLAEVDLITKELRAELKAGLMAAVEKNSKSIETESKKIIEEMLIEFKNNLATQVQSVQTQLQQHLQDQLTQMNTEVAQLKEQSMTQFQNQIAEKANSLAQELLGRALSSAEQEKLVIDALEKAKKDGFFKAEDK